MDQIVPEKESKTFRGWSQSQKILMPGAGARNSSSGSTALVKRVRADFFKHLDLGRTNSYWV